MEQGINSIFNHFNGIAEFTLLIFLIFYPIGIIIKIAFNKYLNKKNNPIDFFAYALPYVFSCYLAYELDLFNFLTILIKLNRGY